MKSFRLLIMTLLMVMAGVVVYGQNASWGISVEKIEGDIYQINVKAKIPSGFHMYDLGPYEGGPNPTVITFAPAAGVEFEGDVFAITESKKAYDDIFAMTIGKYSGKATFGQRVRLTAPSAKVDAVVEWMLCDATSCLPPDEVELSVEVNQNAPQAANVETASIKLTKLVKAVEVSLEQPRVSSSSSAAGEQTDGSLWLIIIEAIIWGFAALLTPCVFPMVPMTVSFFMKGEGGAARGRVRALIYGIFIVGLYTLPIAGLIIITRIAGGDAVTANIFNWIATHWLPNILFFVVFMVFAASFFGAFEITMPSWMVNKSDTKADSKGLTGIFFLALTLVLVSFSCTGPIVGTVLIKSTSGGEFWTPIATMLAFSSAFALPFTLFAFFPSMLNKLPKSGGWLNSVKVVLGFIEVALGFKFLSVADQTYHWGLLDREIYLAIWIVVFSLLGLYLLGKLKFSHDSEVKYLSVGRLAMAIVTFTFVVYLIPGMWGAPLKGMSGYLPPIHTQDFKLSENIGGGAAAQPELRTVDGKAPKYSEFLHLPHNLQGFFNLEEAEAYAKSVNKPLLVDFTGHGCVNCREMEQRVWSNPEVLRILRDHYVIVALYSDDKTTVPESDWVTTKSGKVLKSLGKIGSYTALEVYGVNAQPYYILQGVDGKMLVEPRGYDLDVDAYIKFLESGIEAFNKR